MRVAIAIRQQYPRGCSPSWRYYGIYTNKGNQVFCMVGVDAICAVVIYKLHN
ncbi:hypothetical protein COO91_01670 [Nostoc flagelliforme CCNUN1]|uniref:Uncharacterized protein n=1 Tax=Nostoc flagelliforme CCNUN1 TaxID=2038116 RepID=A0A2K8SJZ8_9NOSO|nr:hypothetical protein COO91_01670 [Nostoc flagelliforme CCNUN1]